MNVDREDELRTQAPPGAASASESGHVFYLATNKHLKYETQGEVVSLA